jgi:hypothetical protein
VAEWVRVLSARGEPPLVQIWANHRWTGFGRTTAGPVIRANHRWFDYPLGLAGHAGPQGRGAGRLCFGIRAPFGGPDDAGFGQL